jgi:glycosyltransferase involved in cell wall biosynthesis
MGHDVAISAFFGLGGAPLRWDDLLVYPGSMDGYGNDVVTAHAAHHFGGAAADGVVITLVDAWVMNPRTMARTNWCPWTPIDHDPPPPRVLEHLIGGGAQPIAMSRAGHAALEAKGLDPFYVPHGVDTEVYAPMDRAEARELLGWPLEPFVVGMVAANRGVPSRKGFPEALAAFGAWRQKRGGAAKHARLYLHTEQSGIVHGVPLPPLIESLEIGDAVEFVDQYRHHAVGGCDAGYMRAVYSAIDVLLNPSLGEGFGIPIVEAQACGTPVIVTDTTAMPELCGAGWRVGGQMTYTTQSSWQVTPSIPQLMDALDAAYDAKRSPELAHDARALALEYDADLVADRYWRPALESIERRVAGKPELEVIEGGEAAAQALEAAGKVAAEVESMRTGAPAE